MVMRLVRSRVCTLNEARTVYSLTDLLILNLVTYDPA